MNICNFAKVILSRSTKDKTAIDYFNDPSSFEKDKNLAPVYNSSISLKQRFENYSLFMNRYSMQIQPFKTFCQKISRIQEYVSNKKFYQNAGRNGEREVFADHFRLINWLQLSEAERKQHKLEKCLPCNTTHINSSRIHKSITEMSINVADLGEQIVENVTSQLPPSTANTKGNRTATALINVLNPLFEKEFHKSFEKCVADSLHLTPAEKSTQKQKEILTLLKENKNKIQEATSIDDTDVNNFLSSGKSFQQHDRERMLLFNTHDAAEKQTKMCLEKQRKGLLVQKKHHGKFENYTFNKDDFLLEIKSLVPNGIVNWTRLGKKYDVTHKVTGNKPQNAGQILFMFAKANGIDVLSLNKQRTVSGRDILRRIRGSKKRVMNKLTIPTPRSSKKIKEAITRKISDGTFYLGKKIAPKSIVSNILVSGGDISEKTTLVYSRKMELKRIITSELTRLHKAGVLILHDDNYYQTLSDEQVKLRLTTLGESINQSINTMRENLKKVERTFHLKMWHDHSNILNYTYINFMTTILYDNANFLTDDEFQQSRKLTTNISVQSIVEKPQLYIFGQSGIKINKIFDVSSKTWLVPHLLFSLSLFKIQM